jgi:hypothetical protein
VVAENQKYVLYNNEELMTFEVEDTAFNKGHNINKMPGIIRPHLKWTVSHV